MSDCQTSRERDYQALTVPEPVTSINVNLVSSYDREALNISTQEKGDHSVHDETSDESNEFPSEDSSITLNLTTFGHDNQISMPPPGPVEIRQTPPPSSSDYLCDMLRKADGMVKHNCVNISKSTLRPPSPPKQRPSEKKYAFPAMDFVSSTNRSVRQRTTINSPLENFVPTTCNNSTEDNTNIGYFGSRSRSPSASPTSPYVNTFLSSVMTPYTPSSLSPNIFRSQSLDLQNFNLHTNGSTKGCIDTESHSSRNFLKVRPMSGPPLLNQLSSLSSNSCLSTSTTTQQSPILNPTPTKRPTPMAAPTNIQVRPVPMRCGLASPFCPRSPFTARIAALAATCTPLNIPASIVKYTAGTFLKYSFGNSVKIVKTTIDILSSDIFAKVQKLGDLQSDGTVFVLLQNIITITTDTIIGPILLQLLDDTNCKKRQIYLDELSLNNEVGYLGTTPSTTSILPSSSTSTTATFDGELLSDPIEIYTF